MSGAVVDGGANGANGSNGNWSWRVEALSALIRQGPATVILALVLGGLYQLANQHVPTIVAGIHAGYERIQAQQSRDIGKLTDAVDRLQRTSETTIAALLRTLDADQQMHREDQKLLRAALDALPRRGAGNAGGQ